MRLTKTALAAVVALAAVAALPSPDGGPAEASPGRPTTYAMDAPDPHTLRVGDQYYAYTTNAGAPWGGLVHVPVLRSADLVNWTLAADAFATLPSWVQPGRTWAPTVVPDGQGFLLFYTATERSSGRQCIGKARAASPTGPFRDTRRGPVVCQRSLGGSIDPYVFVEPNGSRYLIWKNDGNCCGLDVSLWGQRLLSDTRLSGTPRRLLRYDRAWERPLIENPAMVRSPDRGGDYHLFYAANWYDSASYATGFARCNSPLGPCRKVTTQGPWHATTPSSYGPGGASFFTDTAGRNWMALHGWARPPSRVGYGNGGRRSLFIEKVDFSLTRPVVNTSYPYAFHRNAPHPFVDVPTWAHGAVAWAFAEEVVTGYPDGPDRTFRPDRLVTRAAAVSMLRRALGPGGPPVNDLPESRLPVTRGQVAGLLYDAAGNPPVDDPSFDHELTDAESPELRDPVRWMVHDPDGDGPEAAIATGFSDQTFRPTNNVDRVSYVRMLHRMFTPA